MATNYLKATTAQHRQKARKNIGLAQDLTNLKGDYRDWRTIALFYAAVHLVQAYLRDKTTEYPQTHAERDRLINANPHLRTIYPSYRELKQLAVTARYTCLPTNDFDVSEAQKQLAVIQAHIDRLLAPPPVPPAAKQR